MQANPSSSTIKETYTVSLEEIVDNFIKSTSDLILNVDLSRKMRHVKDLYEKIAGFNANPGETLRGLFRDGYAHAVLSDRIFSALEKGEDIVLVVDSPEITYTFTNQSINI
jgi:hypothetical protein